MTNCRKGFIWLNIVSKTHIITRKRLNKFAKKYPDTTTALAKWYQEMNKGEFNSIGELCQVFPRADKVGKLTVFNIGENKVRLIVAIYYNRKKVYFRAVLTHKEYDQEDWKE